ncbi:GNAT family N-acetyltransferase [Hyphobacterium sp. HN65]|uniref:GNAT family N-acetyltransferase n=1 Tax=Hyphobacterium lacteum TaxID=3116575 RepID=A0ABU7LSM4_9PROT|nr:GNAT family N-acetyltransferase [Hyphobacterium sp. HN65]MEE2526922.1 GNAT family N-acetyltransferase [Hyphobacterium sp. HN65]
MPVDISSFGPRLETGRLILRVPEERDLEPLAEAMADEETARHIGGTQTPPMVWRSLCGIVGHWAMRGYGFFTIEDKASGEWLGRVGPWFPHGWPQPEVGWTVKREAWGKGYASEAAARCLDWVFDDLGWESVVHLIHKDNIGSQGVARKLGSKNWNKPVEVAGFGIIVDQWGQTREDWKARAG